MCFASRSFVAPVPWRLRLRRWRWRLEAGARFLLGVAAFLACGAGVVLGVVFLLLEVVL